MQIGRNDLSLPGDSEGEESTCHAGELGSVPGFARSPGEGDSYALQYSGLGNSTDCRVHGVTKSRTHVSDFQFPLVELKERNKRENKAK